MQDERSGTDSADLASYIDWTILFYVWENVISAYDACVVGCPYVSWVSVLTFLRRYDWLPLGSK